MAMEGYNCLESEDDFGSSSLDQQNRSSIDGQLVWASLLPDESLLIGARPGFSLTAEAVEGGRILIKVRKD